MLFDSQELNIQDTNREMITENRMAVKNCILTAEAVNDYLGKEIKGHLDQRLEPNKIYKVYRPKKELEKALAQYNGLDVVDDHHSIKGEKTNRHLTIGASGESATINAQGKVLNTLFITDKKAINDINNASQTHDSIGKRKLSCSYDYTPVFESGTFNNQKYDLWIKDLKLDHVALVKEGRVSDACIADSNIILKGENLVKDLKNKLKNILDVELNDSQLKEIKMLFDSVEYEGKQKLEGKYTYAKDTEKEELKAKDEEELKTKAKDNEKEKEKDEEELKRIKKMEQHEKEELKAKDEEEEEEKRKKEIKDAISKEIKEIRIIQDLCSKVIGGRLSDSALMLDKEELINDTLKTKGFDIENRSYNDKKIMIETISKTLQTTQQTSVKNKQINDSKTTKFVYNADKIKKLIGAN